jgi:hypothetical protein
VLSKRLVFKPRYRGQIAASELNFDPFVAQDSKAPAARLLGRVIARYDDAPDPGRSDRVGARWLLAFVTARLE